MKIARHVLTSQIIYVSKSPKFQRYIMVQYFRHVTRRKNCDGWEKTDGTKCGIIDWSGNIRETSLHFSSCALPP